MSLKKKKSEYKETAIRVTQQKPEYTKNAIRQLAGGLLPSEGAGLALVLDQNKGR